MSDEERVPRRSLMDIMAHAADDAWAEGILQADQADRQAKADAAQLRAPIEQQSAQKPTYKEVYTRYRRRHAKNPKVTIREVCEDMGADYDNIRAAKYRATKNKK